MLDDNEYDDEEKEEKEIIRKNFQPTPIKTSNSFSSLENFNKLITNLIYSNKETLPLKHINKLVSDLTNLFNDPDYYDVEIRIGKNDDFKIFKAHSNILKSRSLYFKTALSDNWLKKSKDGIILFEKENISPKIFDVLLSYIYNGIINIDNLNPNEVLELLEACDELCFDELIEDLQKDLIKKKEWVEKNLVHVHKISVRYQSFNLLRDYCGELIDKNPKMLLKSNDVTSIEKPVLTTILKRDNLVLNEIDIWNCVIEWGIGQNEKWENDISGWNKDDFKELKTILKDIVPLIRFNGISGNDFHKKVRPYKKAFDKEIYEELVEYYFTNNWQPKLLPKKSPRAEIKKRNKKPYYYY